MRFGAIILGRTRAANEAAFEAARNDLPTLLIPHIEAENTLADPHDDVEPISRFQDAVTRSIESRSALVGGDGARLERPELAAIRARFLEVDAGHSIQRTHRLAHAGIVIERSRGAVLLPDGSVSTGDGKTHDAPTIVVATGSRPRHPARFAFDGEVVCDAQTILRHDRPPRSLLVIGAESAGCEIACLFASLGTAVTIVDRRTRSLRYVDRDLLEILHARMRAMGIELILDESIGEIVVKSACSEPHAAVELGSGRIEICDRVVVMAGPEPICDGLDLEAAGVAQDDHGFIVVDELGRTSRPGIYAIGGVVSSLTENAEALQGRLAIRDALGLARLVEQPVPLTIHTIPEISMVGITEEVCTRLDVPHVTASVSFDEIAWGQLRHGSEGLLKIVAHRATGEILGVQVIGRDARDLIHLGGFLMRQSASLDQLADTIFNTGSASEAYWVAAIRAMEQIAGDPCSGPTAEER